MKKRPVNRTAMHAVAALSLAMSLPAIGAVSVTVSPKNVSLPANGSQQYFADVPGGTTRNVTWLVNGVPGGAPSMGTITSDGLYKAPAGEAGTVSATVTAVSQDDPLASDATTVSVAAPAWNSPVFYVATNGRDSDPGSAAKPWKTIQHAVDKVPAGATVQVASGTYKELVNVKRSGSATAGFITLASDPQQPATIDGTGLVGIDDNQGLITLNSVSYVRIQGFELKNFKSTEAKKVPLGIFVQGSGDHIEIRNNHIHDIKTTVTTSKGSAFGLAIYGTEAKPLSNIIVDGNTLDTLTLAYSESLTVNGNVTGWQVTNNTVHGNNNIGIDAIGFEGTAPSDDQARNGWIANNTVYDITSVKNPAYKYKPGADGIYVDGGTHITIEGNSVRTADLGIELASEHGEEATSDIILRNNIVQDSLVTGISIGGFDSSVGGTKNCSIINNTLINNDTSNSGSGELQIQYNASNNLIANNIFYANKNGLLINSFVSDGDQPATLENNLYYTAKGKAATTWMWKGTTYLTLADFQKKTQADVGGLVADPLLVSNDKYTVKLSPNSPAIGLAADQGLVLQGLYDRAGSPRRSADGTIDDGALQH